jgi:hypothetical protein
MDLTQQFHLLATAIFVLGSAVVGLRLVLLSGRTRQRPELLLGSAILGTAVLGYGVLISAMILRGGMDVDPAEVPASAVWLTGIGKILHNLGVTCFFLFVLEVFRRGVGWARGLVGLAMLLLWGGLIAGAVNGSFRAQPVGDLPWWCEYVVIWTYAVWLGIESLRYWSLMRKRAALGLADPMVTNRFALYGLGSVFSVAATWTASIPFLFASDAEMLARVSPFVYVATAIFGLASVSCSYLAFLPPSWYARRIVARAAASA